MSYSKEEIESFKAKDLRISKLAILKSLIEKLSTEVVNEVDELIVLADKYVNYVYGKNVKGEIKDEEKSWVQIAEGLNLAPPNPTNIKMLDILLDEYKKVNKASANPSDMLSFIMTKFGSYPSKKQSVEKVLEMYKEA